MYVKGIMKVNRNDLWTPRGIICLLYAKLSSRKHDLTMYSIATVLKNFCNTCIHLNSSFSVTPKTTKTQIKNKQEIHKLYFNLFI